MSLKISKKTIIVGESPILHEYFGVFESKKKIFESS